MRSDRRNLLVAGLIAASLACSPPAEPEPSSGAVRLAALTASAAADAIDDLQAVDDPDAAGVRDAFHSATREALTAAREARDVGPHATAVAFAASLDAAEAAERLGDALVLALEARDSYDSDLEQALQSAARHVEALADASVARRRYVAAAQAARDRAEAAAKAEEIEVAVQAARGREARTWQAVVEADALKIRAEATLDSAMARAVYADSVEKAEAMTAGPREELTAASDTWREARREHSKAKGAVSDLEREAAQWRRRSEHKASTLRQAEVPTLRHVEALAAYAKELGDQTAELRRIVEFAAERAEQAMRAAEVQVDEAIAAYRGADRAWREVLKAAPTEP